MYGHLYALSKNKGYIFATNFVLGKLMNLKRRSIIYSLNRLKDSGYIYMKYDDNFRTRRIYLTDTGMSNLSQGYAKNGIQTHTSYCTHNNIIYNYDLKFKELDFNEEQQFRKV